MIPLQNAPLHTLVSLELLESLQLRTRAWKTNAISLLMALMVAPIPLPGRSAPKKTNALPENVTLHVQESALTPYAQHAQKLEPQVAVMQLHTVVLLPMVLVSLTALLM